MFGGGKKLQNSKANLVELGLDPSILDDNFVDDEDVDDMDDAEFFAQLNEQPKKTQPKAPPPQQTKKQTQTKQTQPPSKQQKTKDKYGLGLGPLPHELNMDINDAQLLASINNNDDEEITLDDDGINIYQLYCNL